MNSAPAVVTTQRIIPLVLRRMRTPLLTLIVAYSIAVMGLVLIPGQTADGQPYRVDFFHAFYFVSFTASTIGFGEIPHSFTGAQRIWVLFSLYLLVIAWFYAIGTLVGLVRDPAFQLAVTWNRFRRAVGHLGEPFYLVCGYGDTGSKLVRVVSEAGRRAVVIDHEIDRINELAMADLRSYVPALCGDAALSDNLIAAGLTHPRCRGLLAVTDVDHTNLHIAITSKLLNPSLEVIARAETQETRDNMTSFGTDYVINPFDTFAGGLAMAIQRPNTHRLYDWISTATEIPLTTHNLPPSGKWLICGYGRLGQALYRRLRQVGISPVVVAVSEPGRDYPYPHIEGKGTEAVTLKQAGIEGAVGVIAASEDDADNLSIIMTARELKPNLFLIGRQNHGANRAIFEAAQLDMIMEPSSIMAVRMLRLLTSPMLPEFLRAMTQHHDDHVGEELDELEAMLDGETPLVWTVLISPQETPAAIKALDAGISITAQTLFRDHRNRLDRLPIALLMIRRERQNMVRPSTDTELKRGDRLLLCGRKEYAGRLNWTVNNVNALRYAATGEQRPDGSLWRWIARHQKGVKTE